MVGRIRDAARLAAALGLAILSGGAAAQDDVPLVYEVKSRSETIQLGGKLWLDTKLTNRGERPVRVYWGDYAYTNMYRFEILGPDGRRVALRKLSLYETPLPIAAEEKYFRQLDPGKSASYSILLSSHVGANAQLSFFNQPGVYSIDTSFHVETDHILNRDTGQLRPAPEAWTGTVFGPPVIVKVEGKPDPDAVRIRGRVTGPNGKPIVGAFVRGQIRMESYGSYDGWTTMNGPQDFTDKDGRYVLRQLPGKSPLFLVQVAHENWAPDSLSVTNSGKKQYERDVRLAAGVRPRGQVQDENGVAVHGARVTGAWGALAITDPQGQFQLPTAVAGDKQRVNVFLRGFKQQSAETSQQQATDGSWVIPLERESKSMLRGLATLASGEKLAKARLEFRFTPADGGQTRGDRTETDGQGRFEIALPGPGAYDISIYAEEPTSERHLPHESWETHLTGIQSSDDRLVVEFKSDASLEIDVQPSNELPAQLQLKVTTYRKGPAGHTRMPLRESRLGPKGGKLSYPNISPGKFRVSVQVEKTGHWSFSQDVDSPADGGQPAKVSFKLPKLDFGRVSGIVRRPDGTPAAKQSLWFDSAHGWGSLTSDENGRYQVNPVPAGRFFLSSRDKRYAELPSSVEVPVGGAAEMDLKLRDINKVMGWAEGRLLFEDGSPIVGASDSQTLFGRRAVNTPPGGYKRQYQAGDKWISFNLGGAVAWLEHTGRKAPTRFGQSRFSDAEQISFPLKITAGKTLRKDFVLSRKNLGSVRLTWSNLDPKEMSWSHLYVDTPAMRHHRALPLSTLAAGKSEFLISGIPPGRRLIVLRSSRSALWLAALAGEKGDSKVHFDGKQTAQVKARVVDQHGKPMMDAALKIESTTMSQARFEWSVEPLSRELEVSLPRTHKSVHIAADGTHTLPPLSPGKYHLHVARGDISIKKQWSDPLELELTAGDVVLLEAKQRPDGTFELKRAAEK